MNKSELIDAVAEGAGLSKADATSATEALLDSIVKALGSGDQVALTGFGTFSVRARAARRRGGRSARSRRLRSSSRWRRGGLGSGWLAGY